MANFVTAHRGLNPASKSFTPAYWIVSPACSGAATRTSPRKRWSGASQTAYAVPELNAVGLSGYFDPIIISGDFGYRKPDERLFTAVLTAMKMEPSEVLFVGNDMFRDVYGAQRLRMKAVFFKSNHGTQEKVGVKPDYIIGSSAIK